MTDDFMAIIKGYRDILVNIDMHTTIKESAEQDKVYYQKQMTASEPHDISGVALDGLPGGNFSPVTLDRAVKGINIADSKIYLEQCNIDRLEREKKAIEDSINKLTGLEYKVAFKRICEKNKDGSFKTLEQIAKELNYSLPTVWNASAEVSKKFDIIGLRSEIESVKNGEII